MHSGKVFTDSKAPVFAALLAAWVMLIAGARAETTFIYTVQITATPVPQSNPRSLLLQWQPDPYGANSYSVYRKTLQATDWGYPIATLDGGVLSFEDPNISPGQAFEYQIIKYSTNCTGYGYIYAGINVPMTESRGAVVLVCATNSLAGLDSEIARLQQDLVTDGWAVIRQDVSSNDTPDTVRGQIYSAYIQDPARINTVFLLGHVPVLLSGTLNYDGHLVRPMPADAYYGDMTVSWPTDPLNSPSYMPSDIELMIGRVDFFDMPGIGAFAPWPSETEMLRNYLNKDHAWRQGILTLPRRALMGNRRGDENGEATAASGYRFFAPIVGPAGVVEADTSDTAPDSQRWINVLGRDAYLLAYGCGGGLPQGIGWLGTNGTYKEAWSRDVVGVDAKAGFVMLFGSWFGEWEKEDNFMRSFLITSTGLGVCMAGRPHWFAHHTALGMPFGYSARLTMNNDVLYKNQVNDETRAIYISWLGDPTLRIDVVQPAGWLSAVPASAGVGLSWSGSVDATEGYHVFRSASSGGPFTRLTDYPVTGLSYLDSSPLPVPATYMVRVVKLENRFSGSYYNMSQGIVASAPAQPPALAVSRNSQGLVLTWRSVPGYGYHVETRANLFDAWSNVSGTIQAAANSTSWTNSIPTTGMAFFRVASP